MNIATQVFQFARRCADRPIRQRPQPHSAYHRDPALAADPQSRHLVLGAERQFHDQAAYLCELFVTRLLDYRDRIWKRQREGLIELLSRFFRRKSNDPALIWGSPIWMRTQIAWRRAAECGIVTDDETTRIRRRGTTAAYSNHHRLRFAGGESVKVNVKQLEFYYPRPSTTLWHVHRERRLLTPTQRLLDIGYEEGLGLGTSREKAALEAGHYTPNELFFQSVPDRALQWLNLMTITLARFSPDPPPEDASCFQLPFGGDLSAWRSKKAFGSSRFGNVPAEEQLPMAATVRFLRLTFTPDDFKVVVLLAAERDLPRFLVEHDGLAQLLVERLAAEQLQA